MLNIQALDGRKRAEACGEALLAMVRAVANLMIQSLIVNNAHIGPEEAARIVRRAIGMFDLVCTDGGCGLLHADLIGLHLFLSLRLWCAGDGDGAFAALDSALEHARELEAVCGKRDACYTAPLLSTVRIRSGDGMESGWIANLPQDWPWWNVPGDGQAKADMKADPRWASWVSRTRSAL